MDFILTSLPPYPTLFLPMTELGCILCKPSHVPAHELDRVVSIKSDVCNHTLAQIWQHTEQNRKADEVEKNIFDTFLCGMNIGFKCLTAICQAYRVSGLKREVLGVTLMSKM